MIASDYISYGDKLMSSNPDGINYPKDQELRSLLAEEIRKLQESDPVRRATLEAAKLWPEYTAIVVRRLRGNN